MNRFLHQDLLTRMQGCEPYTLFTRTSPKYTNSNYKNDTMIRKESAYRADARLTLGPTASFRRSPGSCCLC